MKKNKKMLMVTEKQETSLIPCILPESSEENTSYRHLGINIELARLGHTCTE